MGSGCRVVSMTSSQAAMSSNSTHASVLRCRLQGRSHLRAQGMAEEAEAEPELI